MTNADFTKAVEIVTRRMVDGMITGDVLSADRLVVLVRMVAPPGAEHAVLTASHALYQTRADDLIARATRIVHGDGDEDR